MQNLVDRCATDLKDPSNVTWTEPVLLSYGNDAQRSVVNLVPTSYLFTASVQLAAGVLQSIPVGGHLFSEVTCNMGTSGTVRGRTVRMIKKKEMDDSDRDWQSAETSSVVENVIPALDPKLFYVSPPQPTANPGYIELVYSKAPPDILIGATLLVEDTFANAIFFYMMARAHALEDAKSDSNLITGFMAMFAAELGVTNV